MKKSYIDCLRELRNFRKKLFTDIELKKGKMYFSWLKTKTEKIENEQNEKYIYENIVKYALNNYKIDQYTYERLNENMRKIVDANYILKNKNYVFNNEKIPAEDALLITRKILLKRGNVVWIDFGFNIGNEFGGMHPAVILKNFEKELFVIPISSKKPKEYVKIEKEFNDGNITEEECNRRKQKVTTIIQLDSIYRFKDMTRWTDITRMRKVSLLRLNFSGTIGKIDGKYINEISKKISQEF